MFCTLCVLAVWGEVIFNRTFAKGSKRRLTKDEKQRTSHLAKLKEFKPALIKVSFDNEKIITTKEDEKDESLVICGGGFPLIIRGELRGSILVSGLVHDEDHQVIVDCLRKLKDEGTCK